MIRNPMLELEIVERVELGESITRICSEPDMPHFTTVYYWIRNRPTFRAQYRTARDMRLVRAARAADEARGV